MTEEELATELTGLGATDVSFVRANYGYAIQFYVGEKRLRHGVNTNHAERALPLLRDAAMRLVA